MLVPVREYACASDMLANLAAIRRGFRTYERPVPPPSPSPVKLPDPQPAARKPSRVTVSEVIRAVSAVWGIAAVHILSQRRNHQVMRPRQAVYALACRLTMASLPQIGRAVGGRDHTSILHGRKKMQPLMDAVEARIRPDANVWEWAAEMRKEMIRL